MCHLLRTGRVKKETSMFLRGLSSSLAASAPPSSCSHVTKQCESREPVSRDGEGTWLLCLVYVQKRLNYNCSRCMGGHQLPCETKCLIKSDEEGKLQAHLYSLTTLQEGGSRGGWFRCPCACSCRCSSSLRPSAGCVQVAEVVMGQSLAVMASVSLLRRQQ